MAKFLLDHARDRADEIWDEKGYSDEKLDNLLDGINESYGTVLMEELLNRLELTIKDFNDEMKTLCNQLIKKQEERQHLLEMLKSSEEIPFQNISVKPSLSDDNSVLDTPKYEETDKTQNVPSKQLDEDVPVWEKKLAKLEKK